MSKDGHKNSDAGLFKIFNDEPFVFTPESSSILEILNDSGSRDKPLKHSGVMGQALYDLITPDSERTEQELQLQKRMLESCSQEFKVQSHTRAQPSDAQMKKLKEQRIEASIQRMLNPNSDATPYQMLLDLGPPKR